MRTHCARERLKSTQGANNSSSCPTAYVDDIANAVYVSTSSLLSILPDAQLLAHLPLPSVLDDYATFVDRFDLGQREDFYGCFIQPWNCTVPMEQKMVVEIASRVGSCCRVSVSRWSL